MTARWSGGVRVSVLRGQADGFEGVLMAEVIHRPDDSPFANGHDEAGWGIKLDPACRATPTEMAEKDNALVPNVMQSLGLESKVIQVSSIGVPELAHPLDASIDASYAEDQSFEGSVPLHGRVERGQPRIEVVALPGL